MMDAEKVKNHLIESLKQQNDEYVNIINANHPFPCGICQKNVNINQKAIECSNCNFWIHIKCNGTSVDEYNKMIDINSALTEAEIQENEWMCNKCQISNMANIFPFGLENNYDLQNILQADSLKILENLPSYEITSKASDIDSLKQFDIDENTVTNINSRYYPAYEFQSLHPVNSFNLFHTNLNGLENKFEQLHNFVNTTKMNIDIIGISETTQSENNIFKTNVSIDGYHQPFTLGSKSSRGGVAIYARDNLNIWQRDDLNTVNNYFESVWVEIEIEKSKNIICGCMYRHPNSGIEEFTTYISKCLTKITKEKKECYLLGDFNVDLLKYESNSKNRDFLNALTSYGFLPHILQPTRISDHSSTVIDNIYGNNFEQDSVSGNILIKFADHFSQFLSINKEVIRLKHNDIYKRDLSNFDEKLFIDDVSIQNWNANNLKDTNSKFNDFLWRVEGCVDRHAPIKKLTRKEIKKMSKPWINNYILKLISHRDRLFHQKKNDPMNNRIKCAYNLFRNRITREIKKAKKEYYKTYFETNLCNMKKTWQGIKEIINLNNKAGPKISQLNYEGKQINTNEGMANAFNDFFTKIGPKLDKDIPNPRRNRDPTYYLNSRVPLSFLISPTNPKEINDIISTLDVSKSSGPCCIPTKLLKLVSDEISHPFSDICNSSFNQGVFPDKNKIAKVMPCHKNGSTKDVNNYRPISLLSTFSKIIEKLMASRLNIFLDLHSIIYPNQFGFRAGSSTSHSLISITETIKKTIDEKKFGCGVFIDLKKAFDTVNHDILLQKLEHYGIRDVALSWFKSYLTDRKQYVHINGVDSETKDITCGVPQGSVLGPLLFLLYINDLPNISKKLKFYLFADDTNIYFESADLKSLEKTMNKELEKLHEWLCLNRLSLNITKTNFVIFHAINKPKTSVVTILINKQAIDEVKSVKYLGILIDSQLTFKNQIDELSKKVSRAIGVLYKLRPYVTAKILTSVYYAIVYPFLLYGIVVWGNASKALLEPIHIMQKKIVRMITFKDNYPTVPGPLAHTPPLFHKLKMLKIYDIYKVQVGNFVFESVNDIGPSQSIIKFTRASEIHDHDTRYAKRGKFFITGVRTERYGLRALRVEGRKVWDTIPNNIKESRTKKSFNACYKGLLINSYLMELP